MAVAYRVGGRVPDVQLPRAGGGPLSPVRGRPREAVVLVFPRDDAPDRWLDYLRRLAGAADRFDDWDGRVIAVVDPPGRAWQALAGAHGERLRVLQDPDGRLEPRRDADGGAGRPAVAVVDRFGEIYHVWPPTEGEGPPGPGPRDLEEWLQFLALQCPE